MGNEAGGVGNEKEESLMSDFKPGLEGVVAFETEIAEPDKEGGSLRYRGVDIEELVGHVSFGHVWGLLVDNAVNPGLPSAGTDELPLHTGDVRVDVQSGTATLASTWGLRPLFDITPEQAREDVGRVCATMLSFIAQSARGADRPGRPPAPGRRGEERGRGLPHPLARRARPAAREGAGRLLGERGRARHERLHLHRPGDRLHRRRRRGRDVRARSAPSPDRCTAARPPGCCTCSTRLSGPATRKAT